MFDTYQNVFNQRGQLYHQAMMKYPLARQAEFDLAIQWAKLSAGQTICDIPSGGCYLSDFIPCQVKLFSVETSTEFMRCAQSCADETTLLCEDLGQLTLLSNQMDHVISLAGSHHLADKASFYQEVHRILKPAGLFCLADVRKGSGVDGFLNTFVDQHSSMGHQGDFLTEATAETLSKAGFEVIRSEPVTFRWKFATEVEMADCCRLLFGIDQANETDILNGIRQNLGYEIIGSECFLNWELYFFQAAKPLPTEA